VDAKEIIAVVFLVAYINSCTTQALWDAVDPDEYIEVTESSVTVEQLESKGVGYYIDDSAGRVFVEKSGLRKFGNYTVRTFATPVTVTVDTVAFVVIGYGTSMFESEADRIEWKQHRRELDPDIPLR